MLRARVSPLPFVCPDRGSLLSLWTFVVNCLPNVRPVYGWNRFARPITEQRSNFMAEPAPGIDFANLPTPDQGILVTLFITVRKVARSRDFYSRILGGTVVMDENPCIVKLSNSWIIM